MIGFKTLARGEIDLNQVRNKSLDVEKKRQLHLNKISNNNY